MIHSVDITIPYSDKLSEAKKTLAAMLEQLLPYDSYVDANIHHDPDINPKTSKLTASFERNGRQRELDTTFNAVWITSGDYQSILARGINDETAMSESMARPLVYALEATICHIEDTPSKFAPLRITMSEDLESTIDRYKLINNVMGEEMKAWNVDTIEPSVMVRTNLEKATITVSEDINDTPPHGARVKMIAKVLSETTNMPMSVKYQDRKNITHTIEINQRQLRYNNWGSF